MLAWLEVFARVVFGLAPYIGLLLKKIFPNGADEVALGVQIIEKAQDTVKELEASYPQDGLGTAKYYISMGEAAKKALDGLNSISTGGQKEFIDSILMETKEVINATVKIVNDTVAASNDPKDNPVTPPG